MNEREKCEKTSHHQLQCAKLFSRYSISKSGILARWTSPFCKFSASFSLKYDITNAMLQENEMMKVQYLRSLCLKLYRRLELGKGISRKGILLTWQPKSKLLSIIEKQKIYCLKCKLKQYSFIVTAGSIKF